MQIRQVRYLLSAILMLLGSFAGTKQPFAVGAILQLALSICKWTKTEWGGLSKMPVGKKTQRNGLRGIILLAC